MGNSALRIDVPLGTAARRRLFCGFAPFGRSPFGDYTCSGRVNRPCAKVLRCKTLGTPDFRRGWIRVVRTSCPCFSLFPKELWGRLTNALVSGTMSARNGGFAVAPYLCRYYYHSAHIQASIKPCCTLPMQVLLLLKKGLCIDRKGVAPYLYRYYYCVHDGIDGVAVLLHLTYTGIITHVFPGIFAHFLGLHLTYTGIITH